MKDHRQSVAISLLVLLAWRIGWSCVVPVSAPEIPSSKNPTTASGCEQLIRISAQEAVANLASAPTTETKVAPATDIQQTAPAQNSSTNASKVSRLSPAFESASTLEPRNRVGGHPAVDVEMVLPPALDWQDLALDGLMLPPHDRPPRGAPPVQDAPIPCDELVLPTLKSRNVTEQLGQLSTQGPSGDWPPSRTRSNNPTIESRDAMAAKPTAIEALNKEFTSVASSRPVVQSDANHSTPESSVELRWSRTGSENRAKNEPERPTVTAGVSVEEQSAVGRDKVVEKDSAEDRSPIAGRITPVKEKIASNDATRLDQPDLDRPMPNRDERDIASALTASLADPATHDDRANVREGETSATRSASVSDAPQPLMSHPRKLLLSRLTPSQEAELLAVSRLCDAHSKRGFELAGRNAMFSAKAEFVQSLGMMAQALDAIERGTKHIEAMANGLKALEESDDFVAQSSQIATDFDAVLIARPHRTPVLQSQAPSTMSAMQALQLYYRYAQDELSFAAGRSPASSMALHGLGKVYTALARAKDQSMVAAEPKAIVFFQSALLVDQRNYMASNELGVLLANYGKYEQAKAAFLQSLRVSGQPVTWRNLAVVHTHLGENELAQLAMREADLSARRGVDQQAGPLGLNAKPFDVQWVDPKHFAQMHSSSAMPMNAPQQPNPEAETTMAAPRGRTVRR